MEGGEQERLIRLMRYFWLGSEELSAVERPHLPERFPISQSELARRIGLTQPAIGRWIREGVINDRNKPRLAQFCNCSMQELEHYLKGKLSLLELLKDRLGTPRVSKSQILAQLPGMSVPELLEIVETALPLISTRLRSQGFRLPPSDTGITIASLITENLPRYGRNSVRQVQVTAMADSASLDPDELQALLEGAVPTQEQLGSLTKVLRKPDSGHRWALPELQEISRQEILSLLPSSPSVESSQPPSS